MPDKVNTMLPTTGANGLAGISVLLTRPLAQVHGIADAIAAHGGTVTLLPLLEIEAVTSGSEMERVKTSMLALDNYDHAIFISTNAATLGLEWIDKYWPQLPQALDVYAVGPGTALVLKQLPWQVHCSDAGVTSEDMLTLPGLQDVKGQRIALFRGEGGRELLAQTLRARGARVDYIELYRRLTPAHDPVKALKQIRRAEVNTVVATSPQILDSLLALCESQTSGDKDAGSLLSLLQASRLLVPSQRVVEKALEAGFNNVTDARGADDKSVLMALLDASGQRAQG